MLSILEASSKMFSSAVHFRDVIEKGQQCCPFWIRTSSLVVIMVSSAIHFGYAMISSDNG